MEADSFPQVEVRSEHDLWSWLDANHAASASVWLVTWKAARRDRYVSRDQVLDALIAYGWIDGRRMKLDAERTMQLIAPRAQQVWAKTYQDRAKRLIEDGRMQPAGRAVLEMDRNSGHFDQMSDVDALVEPLDLLQALRASGGDAWWAAAAPSYRRNILRWLAAAKRDATRHKRIAIVTEHSAKGTKVPHY